MLILAEHENRLYWFEPRVEIPLVFAYVVVIIVGLVTNAIVAWLVVTRVELRTAVNLYVANLAASDLMMCTFCLPFTLVRLLVRNWTLGATMCRALPWLQSANVFASTTTVTVIALHRYGVIVDCDSGVGSDEAAERRTALKVIAGSWVVSGLFGLPMLFYSRVERAAYEHLLAYTMCLEEWPSVRIRTIYAITVLALQFAAPVFVLSAIHLRICCFLRRQVSGSALISRDSRRAANIARRYRKNLALLVTICAMFAVCWLPLVLLNLLADLASEVFAATDFTLAFATAHVIAMSSACINPVLYGWFNPSFKHELKRLLLFWLRDTTNQSSESQSEAPPLSPPHSQSPPHSPPHSPLQSPPQLAPSCPEASVPTFNRRTRYSTFSIRNNIVKSGVSQWTKSGDNY